MKKNIQKALALIIIAILGITPAIAEELNDSTIEITTEPIEISTETIDETVLETNMELTDAIMSETNVPTENIELVQPGEEAHLQEADIILLDQCAIENNSKPEPKEYPNANSKQNVTSNENINADKTVVANKQIEEQPSVPVYPTYTVKNKSTLKLDKGNQVQIAVSGKAIKSCKSSKKKVVSVSKSGFITAKTAGTAKITITTTDKKKIKMIVKVTDPTIPTGISISNGKKATLYRGQTLSLTAAMKPATATSKLTWKSSNKKVASVNSDGVITAKKAGKTTITVKTHNGKKATIKITVAKGIAPHIHTWEDVTETVTVVDTPAWDEVIEDEPASTTTAEYPAEGHWETIQTPAVTHVVHHDAVTHEEQKWVVDKAAWTETKYKDVCVCGDCGRQFNSFSDYKAHIKSQLTGGENTGCTGRWGSIQVADGTIEHPEEGHYENVTIVDTPEWDETVIDVGETTKQEWIIDKPTWTETIEVPAKTHTVHHDAVTHTETKITGQRCTECGATK